MWQASWKATEGETVFESASEDVSATCAVEALRWMGRDSEECQQWAMASGGQCQHQKRGLCRREKIDTTLGANYFNYF
jgi:hypothetical protein